DRFTGADIEQRLRRRIALGGNGDVLADAPVEITNVPHLHDVVTTVKLLGELGAKVTIDQGTLSRGSAIVVDPRPVNQHVAPYELVKT
ncbi:hypothetical protein RA278_28550, partial [Pseudomonas syringae pv. tagetis]